ncbi:MAG: hypothetical protein E7415_00740 [Ruminococcaceae bacterium]|nr:hypothetical protein [Oscillospiraceae bacterium]
MYDDDGMKGKGVAKTLFILAIIGIILAVVLQNVFYVWNIQWALGLVDLTTVALIYLLFCKLCDVSEKLNNIERKNGTDSRTDSLSKVETEEERMRKLESLRAKGLITEGEYRQAIVKMEGEI